VLALLARRATPSTATVMGRGEGFDSARSPCPSTPGQVRFTTGIQCFQKCAASASIPVGYDQSINDEKSPLRLAGVGKAYDSSTRLRRSRPPVHGCP